MNIIFKNKDLLKIVISQSLSRLGDNLEYIALCILCYDISKNVLSIAILSLMSTIPNILFTTLGGVISDIVNKKKLMVLCELSRSILILFIPIAYYFDFIKNIYIFIIIFIVSIFESFFVPCNNALISCIVKDEEYLKVNATINSLFQIITVVGLAFGGILVSLLGINFAIIIDSITFFISAIFIYFLKYNNFQQKGNFVLGKIFDINLIKNEIMDGIHEIFYNKKLGIFFIIFIIISIIVSPLEPYIAYMMNTIDSSYLDIGIGMLFSVLTFGVILGNLILIKFSNKLSNYYVIVYSLLLSILTMITICLNNLITLTFSILILGIVSGLLRTITVNKMMISVSNNYRARVSSFIILITLISTPLTSIIASFFIQYNFKNLIWYINIVILIFILIIFKQHKKNLI